MRPGPVYTTTTRRQWARLDVAAFRAALQSSHLCQPEVWPALDVNELVLLYDSSITAALDRTIPLRTVRCRRRPSVPWFDEDCRLAKRLVRRMEREARKADAINSAAATAAWRTAYSTPRLPRPTSPKT